MKRILIACGSGIATSTVANQKVTAYLNDHGYKGQFQITQCQIGELAEKGKDADFAIATTVVGGDQPCPVIAGFPLLTGVGVDKFYSELMEQMAK